MAYNTGEKFELTFSIKKIYSVTETGWSRCRIKLKSQKGYTGNTLPSEIDATGCFINVFPGDEYRSIVEFKNSDKYGYSISIDDPELIMPHTAKELVKFLEKRCDRIGKEVIKNAVEVIGIDIVSKVAEDHTLLNGLRGFTEKKKETFISVCESNLYFEELLRFVRTLELPASVATNLYNKFGRTAIHHIKTNPYYLYAQNSISFFEADKLAYKYGKIKWDEDKRIVCALRAYVDYRGTSDGFTCVLANDLLENINTWIMKYGAFAPEAENEKGIKAETGFTKEIISGAISYLIYRKEFISYQFEGKTYLFKKSFYTIENQLAENLIKWIHGDNNTFVPKKEVLKYLNSEWTNLSEKQKEGICKALTNKISVLTGGPGTGKTFTVNVLTKTIEKFHPDAKILLMAPTGRAATRMKQGSDVPASTIHSALKIIPTDDERESLNNFKLEVDFVIMDEASMTDEWLFNTFFNRLSPNASVLIVGDSDQLPSVSAGSVLRDIIKAGIVEVTELDKIHRQSGTSNIVINAHKIKNGNHEEVERIEFAKYDSFRSDFASIEDTNEDRCAIHVVKSVTDAVKSGVDISDIIVLAPMKKGILGVVELNAALQAVLNPEVNDESECVYKAGMKTLRIGDRVLQTKNNYDIYVNNGALGTILDIGIGENKKKYVEVLFDGEEDSKIIEGENIRDLELGYCITIHKSQGSEMRYVVMPIHETQSFMLNKKLIYTAMTRAKESFLCVGSSYLFKEKALVESEDDRLSMLSDMMLNKERNFKA